MMESFPGKIVLPMVGNHDYYPKNQLPGDGSELYDAFLDMWVDWINETDMQETFRKGTCTLMLVSPIVSQRVFMYVFFWWVVCLLTN